MAKKPAAAAESPKKPADPRRAVVEALLALSAGQPFHTVTLSDIAREAGLSLADLRDLFPSKGAILGGLARIIDRQVLEGTPADMASESAHDRVMDVMLRRFDALAPYKEGLRSVYRAVRADPAMALALNQNALNSWRYMLESAGIDVSGGLGAIRVQGAIVVFSRAFDAWLDDEPDLARTMAVLDRELKRGEQILGIATSVHHLTAPFRGLARALCERRRDRGAPAAEHHNPAM